MMIHDNSCAKRLTAPSVFMTILTIAAGACIGIGLTILVIVSLALIAAGHP